MAKSKSPKPPVHRHLSILGDWTGIYAETSGDAPARVKAVVIAAHVENNLTLAIMSRMRPLIAPEDQKRLFESDYAALRDFAAKIEIGWALNLYDNNVREDLHRIRKIRNKFAHLLDVRSFDHAEVSRYCAELSGADRIDRRKGKIWDRTHEERFIDLAHHFVDRFSMDQNSPQRPKPSRNRIGADY